MFPRCCIIGSWEGTEVHHVHHAAGTKALKLWNIPEQHLHRCRGSHICESQRSHKKKRLWLWQPESALWTGDKKQQGANIIVTILEFCAIYIYTAALLNQSPQQPGSVSFSSFSNACRALPLTNLKVKGQEWQWRDPFCSKKGAAGKPLSTSKKPFKPLRASGDARAELVSRAFPSR